LQIQDRVLGVPRVRCDRGAAEGPYPWLAVGPPGFELEPPCGREWGERTCARRTGDRRRNPEAQPRDLDRRV